MGTSQMAGPTSATPSPDYGGTLTSTSVPVFASSAFSLNVSGINSFLNNLGSVESLNANDAGDGPANLDDAKAIGAGSLANWASVAEVVIGANTPLTGLGAVDFYYVHRNPAIVNQFAAGGALVDLLGTFSLAYDGTTATLCYNSGTCPTVVPVPAAVWLLSSAMAGLAGVARRSIA